MPAKTKPTTSPADNSDSAAHLPAVDEIIYQNVKQSTVLRLMFSNWMDLLTHYQTTNLDSSKLKGFADDNFKFDENGSKLSRRVENTGKRRNGLLRAISPFPTVFSKGLFPRGIKRCHCMGMG